MSLSKHAPLKQKVLRGNDAPFMNKELRKAIYHRSKLKNYYNKTRTEESKLNYKKQRNKCVKLRKKAIKLYFKKITNPGFVENKTFWKTVKPFISNKSGLCNNTIMLEKNNRIITDEKELVNMLNDHYINIVENNSDIKPNPIQLEGKDNTEASILEIIEKFKNHTSITKIKETDIFKGNYFTFRKTNEEEIERLFVELNTKASTGEDKIPPKLAKLAKDYLKKPMTEAINSSITSGVFPNKAKRAIVTPLDKGGKDKTSISNYRPVSVLSVFSKIYERVMKNQMVSFLEYKLSSYLSAYRKSYSTQHVLIRLIEEWKGYLDKNYYVGAVLLDLSKAFDCVPHTT